MTLEAMVSTFSVVGEEHKTEVARPVEMAWAPYLDGYAHTPVTEMVMVRSHCRYGWYSCSSTPNTYYMCMQDGSLCI